MKSLEHYWYQSNYLMWLLLPLSAVYCLMVAVRRVLYRTNLITSVSFRVPVIVVGNIVAGGSGKTPLLIALCDYLKSKGFAPGVVSRGYGGSVSGCWQITEDDTAAQIGDEPFMIFCNAGVPVVVGTDRAAAVNCLLAGNACDIVLSDDGLQHYRMRRDIEIAVVDAQRKHGNRFCLPAGPLREPVSRLNEVDLVVLSHAEADSNEASYRLKLVEVVPLHGGDKSTLASLAGDKMVHAVAGIGNPDRFFEQLATQGIDIVRHAFPDHHAYKQSDFSGWQDERILMTEKDAVKCRSLKLTDAWVVRVQADMSATLISQLDVLLSKLKHHNDSD